MSNPVVGHKTMKDGSHLPIRQDEADRLLEQIEQEKARRETLMPDEKSAIHAMFDGWLRLKDFGWREAIYCPKDGTPFEVIEAGSTGIHRCHYSGEWPNGHWWVEDEGDLWPSRPILFRPLPEPPKEGK
jgi:hypothetical protein